MKRVAVVGGGASGMLAAIGAAENGASVFLFERNEKTGKKLYITGKGRCNLTNACSRDVFFENIVNNPRFLYSSYSVFDRESIVRLLEEEGLVTKTERGNRVFPDSDRSSDVINALNRRMKSLGVAVRLNSRIRRIEKADDRFLLFAEGEREPFPADTLVIATGGLSYPSTGSDGDGYRFAKAFGHSVTETKPSLVPLEVKEGDALSMQGLSLKNVSLTLKKAPDAKKSIYEGFGELLFTHFGLSGPLILSASAYYARDGYGKEAFLSIDLKPALSHDKLEERILREIGEAPRKEASGILRKMLPAAMVPVILGRTGIPKDRKAASFTKEERGKLADTMKNLTYTVAGTRGYPEAVITSGGVSVKEVDPKSMESKLVPGLFLAGELLDLDALTGGFNLQIAWTTGYTAGAHAAI